MKTFKKIAYNIFSVFGVLLLVWIAWSFIDVVADNCTPAPVHSNFNIFVLCLEVFGN